MWISTIKLNSYKGGFNSDFIRAYSHMRVVGGCLRVLIDVWGGCGLCRVGLMNFSRSL